MTANTPANNWCKHSRQCEYAGQKHSTNIRENKSSQCELATTYCMAFLDVLWYRALLNQLIGWLLNVPLNTLQVILGMIETRQSSRSGLNPTRTTPPCYNNTTPGYCLYARGKGPNVTNPICWTCKNCSYKCADDCEHCVTQSSTEQF